MEEYHVKVGIIRFIENNDFKFTNRILKTKSYVFIRHHAENIYEYIIDYIKKDIENDADEINIIISRKKDSQ